MAHEPTVSEETELDGLPWVLPDQSAILIGRVTGEGEMSGLAAYYLHSQGEILIGEYVAPEFTATYTTECESQLMSACVREFSKADIDTELSSIGSALLQAWHFGDLTPLSHKQAHVYALREKAGFSRDETATILNISPNTVDTHLRRAKEKLRAAENLVAFVDADNEELTQPDPEFLEEIRDSNPNPSSDLTNLS